MNSSTHGCNLGRHYRSSAPACCSGDPEVWEITLLSLQVSGMATRISLVIGLPLGTWLALGRFRGRSFCLSLINTGMALPPVVVGLWVSIFLWRSGPLGDLHYLHPHGDGHRPDDHRRARGHRADRRRPPAARPAPAAAVARIGRLTIADGLGAVARGAPAAAGRPDGRLWQPSSPRWALR